MSSKLTADLTVAEVEEYREMCSIGGEAGRIAEYFHRRRRRMEDEFARKLGFTDRKDAKKQGWSVQIYLADRMVRGHRRQTTASAVLLEAGSAWHNAYIRNHSAVDVYLGHSDDIRPRDIGSLKLAPGAAIQWPGLNRGLWMAADSPEPIPACVVEFDCHVTVHIGDPPKDEEPLE